MVAKGARRNKSAMGRSLQPFLPLLLLWSGRGELMTLCHVEIAGRVLHIGGVRLFSALYVNELTMRFLHRYDPHPELFDLYGYTLQRLASDEPEEYVLREYEIGLLEAMGYGLVLTHEAVSGEKIRPDCLYIYDYESGPLRKTDSNDGVCVYGSTLLDLSVRRFDDKRTGKESKRLMRAVLMHHLNGVALKTREYFFMK